MASLHVYTESMPVRIRSLHLHVEAFQPNTEPGAVATGSWTQRKTANGITSVSKTSSVECSTRSLPLPVLFCRTGGGKRRKCNSPDHEVGVLRTHKPIRPEGPTRIRGGPSNSQSFPF